MRGRIGIFSSQAIPNSTPPTMTTTAGSDATTTPTAPTTSSPTSTQSFSTFNTVTYTSGSGTWTNPYPSGASTGTGTLNGSAGTTNFVWGTSSGSYPNEVSATSNAYVRTTWPRATAVYYKSKIINSSCTATFNGTANSNGASTVVTFEYGTSSGVYPSSVSAGTVTALTATAVTANVSSLAAGTYYFRTKGVNSEGTTYGTQQSIAVSAKSATAASEQSFTPPHVGTVYEALVVGGGGHGSTEGGGGGGVAASDSVSVGSLMTYAVGAAGTNPSGGVYTAGDNSSLAAISATGGNGGNPYTGVAGSSGAGSGGATYNSTSRSGGSTLYGCEESAGGGGGGAESAGTSGYHTAGFIYTGGTGGAAKSIYGLTVSSGGAGTDIYGIDGYQHGPQPSSTYGGGRCEGDFTERRAAQAGIVRFKYYGP